MVKITHRGQTKQERVIGLELHCYRCDTRFEIEEGDDYEYREATEQRDNDMVYMACPVCGARCGSGVPGTVIA